jgi:hypothetical protein
MKNSILVTAITLLTQSVLAGTDWSQLIELAPNIRKDRVNFEGSSVVSVNLAILPNGKYRAVSYAGVGTKNPMSLTVMADAKSDMTSLCTKWQKQGEKFKAELSFQLSPITHDNVARLKNGKTISFNELENPLTFESGAELKFTKTISYWGQYDKIVIGSGLSPIEYYTQALKSALSAGQSSSIRIDLSDLNSLACDMADGNITFEISRTGQYEAGIPNSENFINLDTFSSLYGDFWQLKNRSSLDSEDVIKKAEIDGFLLGVTARETPAFDALAKSHRRLSQMILAMKLENGLTSPEKEAAKRESLIANYAVTTEYVMPKELQVRSKFVIERSPTTVKFISNNRENK